MGSNQFFELDGNVRFCRRNKKNNTRTAQNWVVFQRPLNSPWKHTHDLSGSIVCRLKTVFKTRLRRIALLGVYRNSTHHKRYCRKTSGMRDGGIRHSSTTKLEENGEEKRNCRHSVKITVPWSPWGLRGPNWSGPFWLWSRSSIASIELLVCSCWTCS